MKNSDKTAEQFQESLNEWDTIFDPSEKPEYSQEQLIRFAELFLDYKLSNIKISKDNLGITNKIIIQ